MGIPRLTHTDAFGNKSIDFSSSDLSEHTINPEITSESVIHAAEMVLSFAERVDEYLNGLPSLKSGARDCLSPRDVRGDGTAIQRDLKAISRLDCFPGDRGKIFGNKVTGSRQLQDPSVAFFHPGNSSTIRYSSLPTY